MKILTFTLGSRVSFDEMSSSPPAPVVRDPRAVLRPMYIPTEYSFGMAVGITGVDTSKDMTVLLRIDDPDGNELISIGPNKLPADSTETDKIPLEYRSVSLAIQLDNVNFRTEGVYKIRMTFNDEELESKDLLVFPVEVDF